MKGGTKSLEKKKAELLELKSQNDALDREVLTKKKEVEQLTKDLETKKKEALENEQVVGQNYKKIFEEQDLALDAQVRVVLTASWSLRDI